MLTELQNKIKVFVSDIPDIPRDIFVLFALVLIGAGVFFAAQIFIHEDARKSDLRVVTAPSFATGSGRILGGEGSAAQGQNTNIQGMYVGSVNGKTYHLPTCSGAMRIKEANKVWFTTKQEAELRGYKPATNCKGI